MAKLQNAVLRDPTTHSRRLYSRSCTVGTSGHFVHEGSTLIPSIKILKKEDTIVYTPKEKYLGEGRFGICYLRVFNHYKVCVKLFKTCKTESFIHEANILSKFNHTNLPYLFGVTVGDHPSLITSFHGINEDSVTLHKAVLLKPQVTQNLLNTSIIWINILTQITNGLYFLHDKHKLIHNDIKLDNVCLTSTSTSQLQAVIVDFGKACDIQNGKLYKLTDQQKEQYKINHPHIAPDLRDGICRQSAISDVYSLGRVISIVNSVPELQNKDLEQFSTTCMNYHKHLRPNMSTILTYLSQNVIQTYM